MSRIDATLVAFAKDNPEALEVVSPNLEIAKGVVTELFNLGMDAPTLIQRIAYHESRDELLMHLHQLSKMGDIPFAQRVKLAAFPTIEKFYMAVLALSEEELFNQMAFSWTALQDVAANETCAYIAFRDTEVFDKATHWAYDWLIKLVPQDGIDICWSNKVRWYIGRREWRRAFDEVKRAYHGIPVQPFDIHNPSYRHSASLGKVGELAFELYENMLAAGILKPVAEQEIVLHFLSGQQPRYSRPSGSRKGHVATMQRVLPGMGIAQSFLKQQGEGRTYVRDVGYHYEKPYIFTVEGSAILRLAAYFDDQRNERRRVRYKKAVEDYNASRK